MSFEYLKSLVKLLLRNYHEYFSGDVLNSEGRKVISKIARLIAKDFPEYYYIIRRIRREPTIENVIRLARTILSTKDIEDVCTESPFLSICSTFTNVSSDLRSKGSHD